MFARELGSLRVGVCVLCWLELAHEPVISSDQAPVAWSPILSAEVARIATFLPLMIL